VFLVQLDLIGHFSLQSEVLRLFFQCRGLRLYIESDHQFESALI